MTLLSSSAARESSRAFARRAAEASGLRPGRLPAPFGRRVRVAGRFRGGRARDSRPTRLPSRARRIIGWSTRWEVHDDAVRPACGASGGAGRGATRRGARRAPGESTAARPGSGHAARRGGRPEPAAGAGRRERPGSDHRRAREDTASPGRAPASSSGTSTPRARLRARTPPRPHAGLRPSSSSPRPRRSSTGAPEHRFTTELYVPDVPVYQRRALRRRLPQGLRRPEPLHARRISAASCTSGAPPSSASHGAFAASACARSEGASSATRAGSTGGARSPPGSRASRMSAAARRLDGEREPAARASTVAAPATLRGAACSAGPSRP